MRQFVSLPPSATILLHGLARSENRHMREQAAMIIQRGLRREPPLPVPMDDYITAHQYRAYADAKTPMRGLYVDLSATDFEELSESARLEGRTPRQQAERFIIQGMRPQSSE